MRIFIECQRRGVTLQFQEGTIRLRKGDLYVDHLIDTFQIGRMVHPQDYETAILKLIKELDETAVAQVS